MTRITPHIQGLSLEVISGFKGAGDRLQLQIEGYHILTGIDPENISWKPHESESETLWIFFEKRTEIYDDLDKNDNMLIWGPSDKLRDFAERMGFATGW